MSDVRKLALRMIGIAFLFLAVGVAMLLFRVNFNWFLWVILAAYGLNFWAVFSFTATSTTWGRLARIASAAFVAAFVMIFAFYGGIGLAWRLFGGFF
jgi:hypothetical protein